MILSCGTLSYRQESLQRALEGIARAGFQWVEIGCVCGYCEHITPETMDAADADRLDDQVAGLGLKIASIAGHVDLKYPLIGKGAEIARQGFDLLRARIELACHLQVGIVNTGIGATAGCRRTGRLLSGFRRLAPICRAAGRQDRPGKPRRPYGDGRRHPGVVPTDGPGQLGRQLRSRQRALLYGPGSRGRSGRLRGEIGDWLIHVHIKDHRGGKGTWDFPPLGEGDVDLPAVAAILKQIGYQGPCSLEIEFRGPDSQDPSAEIIDRGVAESFRFMKTWAWRM